jgi:hypothetical protein
MDQGERLHQMTFGSTGTAISNAGNRRDKLTPSAPRDQSDSGPSAGKCNQRTAEFGIETGLPGVFMGGSSDIARSF